MLDVDTNTSVVVYDGRRQVFLSFTVRPRSKRSAKFDGLLKHSKRPQATFTPAALAPFVSARPRHGQSLSQGRRLEEQRG
jgi:hypothetical protein